MRHNVGLEPRIVAKLIAAFGLDRHRPWVAYSVARSVIRLVRYHDRMRLPDVPPTANRRPTKPGSWWKNQPWKACPRCGWLFQRSPNARFCLECTTYKLWKIIPQRG